jgi:hypothetical protein
MITFFIIWFLSGFLTWFIIAINVYVDCAPITVKDIFFLIPALGLGCLGLAAVIIYGIASLLEPIWQKYERWPNKIILQRKCKENNE